jgi:hypothetical protein
MTIYRVNRFEIAIMRIIFKRQRPISVSYITEGFPTGSETFVLEAISKLLHLGFISYNESGRITYNKEKKREILRIIDPLPEPQIKKLTDPTEQISNGLSYARKNDINRGHLFHIRHTTIEKVALVMSVLFFGIVSLLSSAISTGDVYQHIRMVGVHYYHHHFHPDDEPFFRAYYIHVYGNMTGSYNPLYMNAEGYSDDDSSSFIHGALRHCNYL